jgi:gliding-associated putative ABC transporter substrate-binding component GldG
MNNKATRRSGDIIETVIVVAIVIALSWIGFYMYSRIDLTEKKLYTVSQATKGVLGKLEDPVNVEVFMSRDLPPQLVTISSEVKNKLDEYARASKGNFKVKYTDPGDDEKEKERAASQGVNEIQLQVVENEEVSVKKVFFGLVMNFVDKSEAIPQIFDTATLEYELTSRLMKFSMDEKPRIGFFQGPLVIGQQGQQNTPTYNVLSQVLGGSEGLYEIVNINAETDKKLPDNLKAVFIAGTFGLTPSLRYSIDQFLMQGGQVLVLMDSMMEPGQQMGGLGQAYPPLPTIEDQLKKYGLDFNRKLVADPACANARFRAGIFTLQQPYPLWVKIGPEGLNKDVGPVSQLGELVIPYASPMKPAEGVEGVTLTPLFSSSNRSFLLDSPFELDPQQDWKFKQTSSTEQGPFVLGYMVTGKFKTAYDGSESLSVPTDAKDDSGAPLFNAAQQVKEGNGNGRLMVISSAKMISDEFLQQFQLNNLFVANMADMLALGDELSGIRSAPIDTRPLKALSDNQKAFIRWASVLTVPLLLCLLGLLLMWLRGQRRRAVQARYGSAA